MLGGMLGKGPPPLIDSTRSPEPSRSASGIALNFRDGTDPGRGPRKQTESTAAHAYCDDGSSNNKKNRRRNNKSRLETSSSNRGGKNGAASNDGILIKWEKVSGELIIVDLES